MVYYSHDAPNDDVFRQQVLQNHEGVKAIASGTLCNFKMIKYAMLLSVQPFDTCCFACRLWRDSERLQLEF